MTSKKNMYSHLTSKSDFSTYTHESLQAICHSFGGWLAIDEYQTIDLVHEELSAAIQQLQSIKEKYPEARANLTTNHDSESPTIQIEINSLRPWADVVKDTVDCLAAFEKKKEKTLASAKKAKLKKEQDELRLYESLKAKFENNKQ